MKKTILSLAVLSMAASASAQKPDLDDPRLDGIELEYVGRDLAKMGAYVYRDLTYFHLFSSHIVGWNGADGCFSYTLPDGNTLWSFADSFTGMVTEYRNRNRANNLVRNAAMVQTGEHSWRDFYQLGEYVSLDPNDRDRYGKMKTWLRHPQASLTDEQINNGDTDSNLLYWESDGTVIKRDEKPVLQLMWGAVDNTMASQGRAMTEYSLEGRPGDEGYMKLLAHYTDTELKNQMNGFVMESEDGYTYVYGNCSSGLGGYPTVARVKGHDLLGTWEYYTATSESDEFAWRADYDSSLPIEKLRISTEWAINYGVFKYGDYYYMVGMGITGGDITIKQAEYPWGPFTKNYALFRIPSNQAITYGAFVHPQLSRTGEIVVSYNMNPNDLTEYSLNADGTLKESVHNGFARNFNDRESADLYQSHFIRIFNWQKLYGVPNIGPIEDPNKILW